MIIPDPIHTPANIKSVLEALKVDPLHEAEKLTGKSYKEDEDTSNLGFGLHLAHVANTRALLESIGDTHRSTHPSDALGMLLKNGFNLVLTEAFEGLQIWNGVKHPSYDERFDLLFCPRRGILATLETYGRGHYNSYSKHSEGSINSLNFYYNWRPKAATSERPNHSGGGCMHSIIDPKPLFKRDPSQYNPNGDNYLTVGYFDGREAAFSRLAHAEEHGEFVTPWLEQPHLWLLTYADTKDPQTGEACKYDYKAISQARLAKLPPEVRAAILG